MCTASLFALTYNATLPINAQHSDFYKKYKEDPEASLGTLPKVQCIPFNALMSNIGVAHIDFWVLDVEGGELSVLRG